MREKERGLEGEFEFMNPPGCPSGGDEPKEVGPDYPGPCIVVSEVDPFEEFDDDAMSLMDELETYGFEEMPWEDDVSCDSMEEDYEEEYEPVIYGKYTTGKEKEENKGKGLEDVKEQIQDFFQKQQEKKAEKTREKNETKEKKEQQKRIDKLLKKSEERREELNKVSPKEKPEEKNEIKGKQGLQERIDKLQEKAAERREELNKLSTEKAPDEKQTNEKEMKPEKLQVKVAEKTKASEKVKETNPKLENFKQSIWELNTIEGIYNDLYQEVNNSENWTKEMDQSVNNMQERIEDQKEMIEFWGHLGTLSKNDIENNQTDVENLNNSILENMNLIYEFALENPTTYEKNVEHMAQRLNESKNNLVSRFQDINYRLENANPNNPYEMESLLHQMEQQKLENLDHELNEALAENQKEGDKQRTTEEEKILESIKQESKIEKPHEQPTQTIGNKELTSQNRTKESTKGLEKTESTEKEEVKLVYENVKERGTELRVYSDGTLKFKGSVTKQGMVISNNVLKWKELPQSKVDGKVTVLANYQWETTNGEKLSAENVESEIYNNDHVTLIRPVIQEENNQIRENMQSKVPMRCEIPGKIDGREQLASTDLLNESIEYLENNDFSNLTNMKLVASGWRHDNKFSILKDADGQLYIEFNAQKSRHGEIKLPNQLNDYIENLFVDNIPLITSIDNKSPVVVNAKTRMQRTQIMEFSVPHYGTSESVNVKFTNPELKLNEKAEHDFKIVEALQQNGYDIVNIRGDTRELGQHKNPEVEHEFRSFIDAAFAGDENATVYHEPEILTNEKPNQVKEASKHSIDTAVSVNENTDNPNLIGFEFKTELSTQKLIDEGLGQLNHLENELGSNDVISVLLINDELRDNYGKVLTKEFGEQVGIRIIGKQEFNEIKNNPEQFKEIIREFEGKKHAQKGQGKSMDNNNQTSLEKVLPENIEVIGSRSYEGVGKEFESEVKEELLKEGIQIFENQKISYFDRSMELDFITINNDDEMTVIECIDKSSTNERYDVIDAINEVANELEFRVDILDADKGELYVKVDLEHFENLANRFDEKNWSDKIIIRIIENKPKS